MPAVLFDGGQQIAPPGQNLVRVCLVPHVPDQTILRRVKGVMQRHGQFNRAQRSAGVPAYAGHCFQDVLTDFVGDLLQLIKLQEPQIRG